MLPTIFISESTSPNQQPGNAAVSVQKLIKYFGSNCGIILKLKRIAGTPTWNSASVVLVPDYLVIFFCQIFFGEKVKDNISKRDVINAFLNHFYCTSSIAFVGGRLSKTYQQTVNDLFDNVRSSTK